MRKVIQHESKTYLAPMPVVEKPPIPYIRGTVSAIAYNALNEKQINSYNLWKSSWIECTGFEIGQEVEEWEWEMRDEVACPKIKIMNNKELRKGCVVFMKASSNCPGYGDPQCVSSVCNQLGTISLYGHNQHFKTYDVAKIIEWPPEVAIPKQQPEMEEEIIYVKIEDMIARLPKGTDITKPFVVEFGSEYQLEITHIQGCLFEVTNGVNGWGNNCKKEFENKDIILLTPHKMFLTTRTKE